MNIEKTKDTIKSIPREVTLVAVTKNQDIDDVHRLYKLGVANFAENKLQELEKKQLIFPDINWHFIGRIQSNKIKNIVKHSTLIHSVSEIRYLEKINLEAAKLEKKQSVLLQLNLANEQTKKGLSIEDFNFVIDNQKLYPNTLICGLMVMGNHVEDNELITETFRAAQKIFKEVNSSSPQFNILSMGMSADYKLAIECGSTMVRIGSLLFTD